jgi:hydroxymethylpyrimidine/phosphomethylpyrimidine kinase
VTVQDSGRVYRWQPLDEEIIRDQMLACCNDGPIHAVKTGMLGGAGAVETVEQVCRERLAGVPLVVDPVLVAGSGDSLAGAGLAEHVLRKLIPIAALVTPNLDEAEALTGLRVRTQDEMRRAAERLVELGARSVLVKGGHLEGEPVDVLAGEGGFRVFHGRRSVPGKVHGTGCTLASGCAALLGAGFPPDKAVEKALFYLRAAIRDGFRRTGGYLIGHFPGTGPGLKPRRPSAFYSPPRFCPGCGTALVGTRGHLDCPSCGLVYYRNPLPAVMVLATDSRGRVLLVRRAFDPGKGLLCLPGGFMDLGETPEECARRELLEETGLSAGRMTLSGSDFDTTDYGGVALYIFRARELSGNPVPGDDAAEILWLPPGRIPPLAFAAHDRALSSGLGDGVNKLN